MKAIKLQPSPPSYNQMSSSWQKCKSASDSQSREGLAHPAPEKWAGNKIVNSPPVYYSGPEGRGYLAPALQLSNEKKLGSGLWGEIQERGEREQGGGPQE